MKKLVSKLIVLALITSFTCLNDAHAQALVNRFEASLGWNSIGNKWGYGTNIVIDNPAILSVLPFGQQPAEFMIEMANDYYTIGMFRSGGHQFGLGEYHNPAPFPSFGTSGSAMSVMALGRSYDYDYDMSLSHFTINSIGYDHPLYSRVTSVDVEAIIYTSPTEFDAFRWIWNVPEELVSSSGGNLMQHVMATVIPEPASGTLIALGGLALAVRRRS